MGGKIRRFILADDRIILSIYRNNEKSSLIGKGIITHNFRRYFKTNRSKKISSDIILKYLLQYSKYILNPNHVLKSCDYSSIMVLMRMDSFQPESIF